MRKLKFGFSKSKKKLAVYSKAIMWLDDCNFSHCYIEFENTRFNIPLIYQASSTMLNFMSKPIFLERNEVIHEFIFEVVDEIYDEILEDCILNVGKYYGIKQVVGIVIAEILQLNHNPLPGKKDEFVCSEWNARQLKRLGYEIPVEMNLIRPIHIYNIINYGNNKI